MRLIIKLTQGFSLTVHTQLQIKCTKFFFNEKSHRVVVVDQSHEGVNKLINGGFDDHHHYPAAEVNQSDDDDDDDDDGDDCDDDDGDDCDDVVDQSPGGGRQVD